MNNFSVKKIIPIDNNLSLKECQKLLLLEGAVLGILDENREITSYACLEEIERALKFDLEEKPISLIATLCKRYRPSLQENEKEDYFIAKNPKNVDFLVKIDKKAEFFVNIKGQYQNSLTPSLQEAIKFCSQMAEEINLPIYLIGGAVRDIILQKEVFDIDITVKESAIKFAEYMSKKHPEICTIKGIHEPFNTAKIVIKTSNGEIDIDLASTRSEKYALPGSLPIVQTIGCELKEDIIRRDFTINALAMSLNQATFGNLIDYIGGYKDLHSKELNILHPISFIDDPTRILRGLKFAVRFACNLSPITKKLQQECLKSSIFDNIGGERIKSELKQALNLNLPKCYNKLLFDNIYRLISTEIDPSDSNIPDGEKIQNIINIHTAHIQNKELIWLIYLGCMTIGLENDEVLKISHRLNLSGLETKILISASNIIKNKNILLNSKSMFEVYEFFECHFLESILITLAASNDSKMTYYIEKYLNKLQFISISTTGKTLIERGFSAGPEFGYILRDILKEKINGNIHTKEDEERFLDSLSIGNYQVEF